MSVVTAIYDEIGTSYACKRQPEPCIASAIEAALGGCVSILNVGAGTGSYERRDLDVIAVEPSRVMIKQRMAGAAPVVQARAEALPFANASFDAVLAVLTVHHWSDLTQGFGECSRVARDRVVFLTADLDVTQEFWLHDYFPELDAIDRRIFPSIRRFAEYFGSTEVTPLLIPADCKDGFLGAYWKRPEAYLEARVRASISTFSKIDPGSGLERLRRDIRSGEWAERHADLLSRDVLDLGYRLITVVTARRFEKTE
jgi:SAM-dependent methyltransferase